jgi:iron complex outermembrane receptor protein
LDLSANAGYTRATYENFLDPTSGLQLAGKPISFVPEFTANLAATYHLPWHIYVRGEMIAVGRYHLDDAYTPEVGSTVQGSYELVNAQVGYEIKNFEIYLYARNIFDRHYFNNALNLGPGSGTSSLILQPGDPETCGIALTARF